MDPYLPGFKYSMAALSASLLTNLLHPFDVIKIRFQSKFYNFFDFARS